jgi:hypothetical protein
MFLSPQRIRRGVVTAQIELAHLQWGTCVGMKKGRGTQIEIGIRVDSSTWIDYRVNCGEREGRDQTMTRNWLTAIPA